MAATLFPVTTLDYEQVIQHIYDESTQSLRSTAVATISGSVQVEIDAADGDNIAISDGVDTLVINADGSINIGSSALPTGAATAANQSTEITSLQIIDDIAHSMNAAFNKAVPMAGQLDDTATTAATEDNIAPVRITAQRAAHINIRNNTGTEMGTTTNPLSVITTPGSAGSLQLKTGVYGAISVTTTPSIAKVGASNYANRIILTVNPTNGTIYFGYDASVSSSSGTVLEQGSFVPIAATDDLDVYLVADVGTVNVRITEASDQ